MTVNTGSETTSTHRPVRRLDRGQHGNRDHRSERRRARTECRPAGHPPHDSGRRARQALRDGQHVHALRHDRLGRRSILSRAGGPTLSVVRTQIIAHGRNGGAWNGTGAGGAINSSLAAGITASGDGVGYGLGSQIAPTSIGPFEHRARRHAGALHVRRRRRPESARSTSPTSTASQPTSGNRAAAWVDGDSNYDGLVNLADFNALAGNFGQAAVPESLGSMASRCA